LLRIEGLSLLQLLSVTMEPKFGVQSPPGRYLIETALSGKLVQAFK
jgi:hypothetical protein